MTTLIEKHGEEAIRKFSEDFAETIEYCRTFLMGIPLFPANAEKFNLKTEADREAFKYLLSYISENEFSRFDEKAMKRMFQFLFQHAENPANVNIDEFMENVYDLYGKEVYFLYRKEGIPEDMFSVDGIYNHLANLALCTEEDVEMFEKHMREKGLII